MQRYAASQFTPCTEKFLGIENVLTGKEISLREAARLSSMGDGQGFSSSNVVARNLVKKGAASASRTTRNAIANVTVRTLVTDNKNE
jgi:hypothetical protein